MGSEDQALTVHSKKGRRKPHHFKGKNPHHRDNNRKDPSRLRCYTCDEIGHFAKDCLKNKVHSHKRKGNKRRHHTHAADDDEPSKKRTRYESEYSSSEDEYVLISLSWETLLIEVMIGSSTVGLPNILHDSRNPL